MTPNASYSIESKKWRNEPLVEVLRDGRPWESPWDAHFQFGRVKTAMILYCIDTIKSFAKNPRPDTMIPTPIVRKPDPDLVIRLQTFPTFTTPNGILVDEPFLRLDRVINNPHPPHIGFGQQKAAALVVLKDDLARWLQSVGGWYK